MCGYKYCDLRNIQHLQFQRARATSISSIALSTQHLVYIVKHLITTREHGYYREFEI